mmetsp:Transcript_16046/g.31959  ORF Transcript_16046/g.31959 Transcript_16046/m.31959 type:complete len:112 (-) Transcript_16046:40-375(-)
MLVNEHDRTCECRRGSLGTPAAAPWHVLRSQQQSRAKLPVRSGGLVFLTATPDPAHGSTSHRHATLTPRCSAGVTGGPHVKKRVHLSRDGGKINVMQISGFKMSNSRVREV